MLGAQAHNSSGWPGMLPKVWPAMEYLHANTLEIPVYWEQFEPEPGKFDTSIGFGVSPRGYGGIPRGNSKPIGQRKISSVAAFPRALVHGSGPWRRRPSFPYV